MHKPSTSKGYYGADVAGPVFKRIAQKIYTDVPSTNEIKNLEKSNLVQDKNYETYFTNSSKNMQTIPNVKGMPGMDAVALLENLKVKVKVIGIGKVKRQSIQPGQPLLNNTTIILELS